MKKHGFYLSLNIIPAILYICFEQSAVTKILFSVYSAVFVIAYIVLLLCGKANYKNIPYGPALISIAYTFHITMCMDSNSLLIILILLSAVPVIIYLVLKTKPNFGIAALSVLCTFCILGGQTISLNCSFDKNEPQITSATVIEKVADRYIFDNNNFPSFYVSSKELGEIYVSVSKDIYNSYETGEDVVLNICDGFFGLKYCYIP